MSDIKNNLKLAYLENYSRGNVILDTREEYHANMVYLFDQFNALKAENSSLLTTIESQQKKIDIIKTAKERLVKYTHQCRKDRDDWKSRAVQAEQRIESQKEEIARLRFQDAEWGAAHETLNIQFESLKAITELAVKGLKEISEGGSTGEDARDMRTTADYTLAEIERLSNAQT